MVVRDEATHLRGTASLRPWHSDYYQIDTPMSLEEIRAFVQAAKSTDLNDMEWQLESPQGRPGVRFIAWRVDYIGHGWPVSSVARCIARELETGSRISVTVRVTDLLVVLWFAAVVIQFVAIPPLATDSERLTVMLFVAVLVVFEYVALLQLRRRDPPQIVATRIARSLGGSVTNSEKPPREPFRL